MHDDKRQMCEWRSVDVITKEMSKTATKEMVENQALCFFFFFFFLQPSTVKAFDVIIHTQAVSLTEALFKSTVCNAPLMDSANVSICINGLLLTPTKLSMEPCTCQQWVHLVKPKTEL